MAETQSRQCSSAGCGKKFNIVPQELVFYEQKQLPLPTHCPSCRHKMRMALRSERALYRRVCGKCRESVLSTYPESAPYTVYCQECFWKHIG